jgi:hypothetical protein
MSMTMAFVRSALDSEEPDYESAKALGFEALPFLEELSIGQDILLASKAVYLAGLINGELSSTILEKAATHENSNIRATAASVIGKLNKETSNKLLLTLLNDNDLGVQNIALKFLPLTVSSEVLAQIERVAHDHKEPTMKKVAAEFIRQRSQVRNMGGLATPDVGARGMGRISNMPASETGMGVPDKNIGMGRMDLRAPAVAMRRQSDTVSNGMGAAAGQVLRENATEASLFWEKAALAWERAAGTLDVGIATKRVKKSCGCGSNLR